VQQSSSRLCEFADLRSVFAGHVTTLLVATLVVATLALTRKS